MKIFVLAALLYCVSATPLSEQEAVGNTIKDVDMSIFDSRNSRFVDDLVASYLESFSERIREQGLDPFEFEGDGMKAELPVPELFSVDVELRNVEVRGLSNIVINNINFGLLTQRLTFDVSLPAIRISIGNAAFNITILGHNYVGRTISRLNIIQPRVSGVAQVNVLGAVVGNPVRSIDVGLTLQEIMYDGIMTFQGYDYAPEFNRFVSQTVHNALNNMKAEIDELVEIIAWQLVGSIFN